MSILPVPVEQLNLPIRGMTCMGCVASVQLALEDLPGIQEVVVDLPARLARVTYDPALTGRAQMVQAVVDAGYAVDGQAAPAAAPTAAEMSAKRILILMFLLTLATLVVAACGQSGAETEQSTTGSAQEAIGREAVDVETLPRNADGYTDITVQQLAQMLQAKDFTLVNVHIPYQGEISQTDLFIPFNEITERQDELPAKDEPIVLYCSSGNMSTQAAKTLVELGYSNVLEVDGGFSGWAAAGYELIDKQ